MPIYEFRCKDCDHEFSILQKKILGKLEVEECPECKSLNFKKLISKGVSTFVGEGLSGNAANGYQSGITYHPSTMGKMKGTKIK